jgi:methyl-accepting chemotaxis protein
MSNENREYFLAENELLVSTTDLEGNITYADDNFVRVSGFSHEELIGSPHNIVRHPDMPKEVFADFWHEISAGHSWTGIIKNKQKGGGFYWVKSDVIPLYEDGNHIGYMSVRSAPNKLELENVKALYPQFKSGEQGKLIIKQGKITTKKKKSIIPRLSIKQRLYAQVVLATISLLTVLSVGIYSSYKEKEAVVHLYKTHIEAYSALRTIDMMWEENKHLLQMTLLTDDYTKHLQIGSHLKENLTTLTTAGEEISNDLSGTQHVHNDTNKYKSIVEQSELLNSTLLADIYKTLVTENGSSSNISEFSALLTMTVSEIDAFQSRIDEIIDLNKEQSRVIYEKSEELFIKEVTSLIILTFIFISIYITFAILFSRDISNRLYDIRRYFLRLVKRDYLFDIDVQKSDEIGKVMHALKIMKVQLAFNMEKMKQKAISATRIKMALDNVSTNVMIEDNDRNVIYVNPAIKQMFKNSEEAFKSINPEFNADNMVGYNMGEDNLYSLDIINDSKNGSNAKSHEFSVNGRIFKIVSNPVIDNSGQQLGYVTHWLDRTSEIGVEKEIQSVIHSAVNGDFTQRMALDGKNEFFTMLCSNMNQLLEIVEVSLADIVAVLSSLAKGDLTSKITADYTGAFGELKDSSNMTVAKLKEMILHIKISADTINTAAKEIAIGNVDLAQRTEKQARSLEVTSSSMEELTITVKQNSEHAKQANNLAKSTSSNALKGGEIVKHVVDNMSEINTSSQEIMNIISVIDSIAFQTNILALNAAVEAARAGEQGRGFAVVATEVRNLAQRSAAAAKEVKTLINSSVNKIETGSKLADQAGESITEVVSSIQEVAKLIEEITLASVEQSVGLDQVSQAVLEVDDVTQQNSALVEESSAAASSLEEQVANLAIYVGAFDTGDNDFQDKPTVKVSHDEKPKKGPSVMKGEDEDDWSEF